MKKLILAATLMAVGITSNVFANNADYNWSTTYFLRSTDSGNHFFAASHSPTEVCVSTGVGESKVENVNGGLFCAGHALNLNHSNIGGFQPTSKDGLRLSVDMTSEQFKAALLNAHIQYVG